MKLIEHFSDFDQVSNEQSIDKHNYIRYRLGRIRHAYWLKNRKRTDNFVIDEYDWFIINNLRPGKTCYYGSAGYYLDQVIKNLTVIEHRNIVGHFYPKAHIMYDRAEIGKKFPKQFDNFVVINNRNDHWGNGIATLKDHIGNYVKAIAPNGLLFYSFRDTQIPCWNRLTVDHYEYFYNFAKDLEKSFNMNLLWYDIKFAKKEKDYYGRYDMLENPDTSNGNIKFIFQLDTNTHKINTDFLNA